MAESYENIRKALATYDTHVANGREATGRILLFNAMEEACDPDTIRELLAERDALMGAACIAATMRLSDWLSAGGTVADFDMIAAIAAANGGGNG